MNLPRSFFQSCPTNLHIPPITINTPMERITTQFPLDDILEHIMKQCKKIQLLNMACINKRCYAVATSMFKSSVLIDDTCYVCYPGRQNNPCYCNACYDRIWGVLRQAFSLNKDAMRNVCDQFSYMVIFKYDTINKRYNPEISYRDRALQVVRSKRSYRQNTYLYWIIVDISKNDYSGFWAYMDNITTTTVHI